MRLAYFSTSVIPSDWASSVHVMKMANAYAGLGCEVRLYCPRDKALELSAAIDVFSHYAVDKDFTVIKKPWLKIKGRGYIYAWLVARDACQWGPDVVHSRNLAVSVFASYLGLLVIHESHHPFTTRMESLLFNRLLRSPHFLKLVVITNALRNHFEMTWPILKGKILVAPDGADPFPDDMQTVRLKGEGRRMNVGYTGSLYEGKGMERIVELAAHAPWADFHVVGGRESDVKYWSDLCKELDNIWFYGHQPHSTIPYYLKTFDVLLMPNQLQVKTRDGAYDIGRWTSPLKLFEYMASRRPILCSDVPVLREVAVDGLNMLVCDHADTESWVCALERLSNDQRLAERLAMNAYDEFCSRYTWRSRATRVMQLVQ